MPLPPVDALPPPNRLLMTPAALLQSALTDPAPPPGLSPEALTLWLIKANRWEEAHDIAQEIPSSTGSWLHALLHLIWSPR